MPMKNPPMPGFVLRQCIEPLGLSITAAAAALGVTRTTLSERTKSAAYRRKWPCAFPRFSAAAPKLAYSASAVRPCARPY
jgi:hypothetical protein